MIGGAAVPRSSWSIAHRLRHGRGAIAHRSASACPSACRGTPQACSGFRPAAFGSFAISQAPPMGRFLLARVGKPIAVTAGEQASGSVQLGDAATAIHSVCGRPNTRTKAARHRTGTASGDGDTLLDVAQSSPYERLWYFSVTRIALGRDIDRRQPLVRPLIRVHENHPRRSKIAEPIAGIPASSTDRGNRLDGGPLPAAATARASTAPFFVAE